MYSRKDSVMVKGVHNYSEIGKLNKVLLHKLDKEIEGLVPDNFERLLFDDIPYLKVAQEEHDYFANLLTKNGIEVVYYVDETAKALKDIEVRKEFIRRFTDESNIYSEAAKESICEYLIKMPVKEMVKKVISGIKKTEIGKIDVSSLADFIASDLSLIHISEPTRR